MSRQLKELNDMLAAKEALMSECVSEEQKAESLKKQLQLEAKVRILSTATSTPCPVYYYY
jgi:predicted RecB family endonuclease